MVGGGPAGLACAAELAGRGIGCTIIERREALGGRAQELACKGSVHCRQCDVCRAHRLRDQVLASEAVTVLTGVELEQVERCSGRYRFALRRPTEAIDGGRCSRCGKCVEACPTGAMAKRGGRIRLDRGLCRSLQGLECERCVSVCPVGAIDLFGEEHLSVSGGAVVVATGAREFPPAADPRLGWGLVPGVISSMQLEAHLEGRSPIALGPKGRVAFVLCVGSRTSKAGTQMCSAVCCKYSLRQALALRERAPALGITMFIMDWRGLDGEDALLRELEGSGIQVVRARPAEVVEEEGRPAVRYAGDGTVRCEAFDVVILSIGLIPALDDGTLTELGVPRDELGNLVDQGCGDRGLFLAGSCLGPRDIGRCIEDGISAARDAIAYLEGGDG
ncbi:MAG TPA: FAD-dependent oxidoreductase [Methanomassiliicoccales archaeon]|nr:FAD-dependent oxidoreductase [Methanomassiliicoccales archaeon]